MTRGAEQKARTPPALSKPIPPATIVPHKTSINFPTLKYRGEKEFKGTAAGRALNEEFTKPIKRERHQTHKNPKEALALIVFFHPGSQGNILFAEKGLGTLFKGFRYSFQGTSSAGKTPK